MSRLAARENEPFELELNIAPMMKEPRSAQALGWGTEVGCIVPPWGTIRHGALLRVLNSTPWGTISVDFPNSAPGEGALLGKMV